MICPICKKTIPDNTLKCPYCKARTGLICKNCNTINSLFDYTCKNCGSEILKLCPNCSSVNIPTSEKCRKCGYVFEKPQEKDDTLHLEYCANMVSQKSAKEILVKGIKSTDKKIFSLSGTKGSGKSLVLKNILKEFKNYVILKGKCTPITQITPGGVIQDILLNLFNLPNFCLNNAQFQQDASKFFKNEFPELSNNEVNNIINFLYPIKDGKFEEIVSCKNRTFEFLNKIFDKIILRQKYILIIDNFDFIDGFSYEFISKYIKKENVWKDLKFILIYNEPKPAKGYFYFPSNKDENIYLDVCIAPLDLKQAGVLIEQKKQKIENFPDITIAEFKEIYQISGGNPSYINQALCLRHDCILCEQPFELSKTFKGVLEHRLALLSHLNPQAYNILLGSAIIGDKINVNLIKEIFDINNKNFKEILIYLRNMDYINPLNEIYCEFTSQLLWETILKTASKDENYLKINKHIFEHLVGFTFNSHAILGIIAQNLKQPELALDIWTKNTKLASYVGDLNLYAISQKQSLALINEFDENETLKIRYNISERLGKLLANSNPTEAMEYLPDAISNAQAIGDSPREIELLAYLASCCRKTGNYFGEVECTDSVLEKVKPENILDIALLKATKLNALLNIGNCGQIINMIDNEIMPALDQYLSKKNNNDSKFLFIYETWLKTYLILANALVIQGNDRSFEILTILFDIIERNEIKDNLFVCKCKLTLAFANTMKGNFQASEKILSEVLKLYRENVMDNETITRWNFINIINNFFRKKYYRMQEDLFQIVTFANNNGDNFTKNILKTMLGKIFKDNENTKQAMEIYNDQIAYFAKEKMALGALLTWYFISEATLDTEGPQNAFEVAEQALAVAQNPKIDNYFFTILFKIVIAKCAITTSDFETAKNNIESAILLAQKYNLKDLLSRLYLLYGKYFQELGLIKSARQVQYLQNADQLYAQSRVLIEETQNKDVYKDLKKSQNVLRSFCQLNSIEI